MPAAKDRLVSRIKGQYVKRGYSEEDAERIAWATVTKQEQEQSESTTEESSE